MVQVTDKRANEGVSGCSERPRAMSGRGLTEKTRIPGSGGAAGAADHVRQLEIQPQGWGICSAAQVWGGESVCRDVHEKPTRRLGARPSARGPMADPQ